MILLSKILAKTNARSIDEVDSNYEFNQYCAHLLVDPETKQIHPIFQQMLDAKNLDEFISAEQVNTLIAIRTPSLLRTPLMKNIYEGIRELKKREYLKKGISIIGAYHLRLGFLSYPSDSHVIGLKLPKDFI